MDCRDGVGRTWVVVLGRGRAGVVGCACTQRLCPDGEEASGFVLILILMQQLPLRRRHHGRPNAPNSPNEFQQAVRESGMT